MGETGLIQTIVILAACIVFLAKQAFESYRKYGSKNGVKKSDSGEFMISRCKAQENSDLIKELHSWHKPVNDPDTGQPRFLWYDDAKGLREELKKNSTALEELRNTISKMNDSISSLVAEIRSQKVGD